MTELHEDLFTGKTNEYDRLRPKYPDRLFQVFAMYTDRKCHIADIGSGTGYLTLPLLQMGHTVEAIEPNDDMRITLQEKVKSAQLTVRNVNAKSTGLKNQSIDIITMGNVAHWLDGNPEKHHECLIEFKRILKPNGRVAVFSLSPDITNAWILDIFNMAQRHDATFDIEKISRTFSQHGFHARNFISDPIESGYYDFSLQMDAPDFHDFMMSHSFCESHMKKEIDTVFARYSKDKTIDVKFTSSVYVGSLKTILGNYKTCQN